MAASCGGSDDGSADDGSSTSGELNITGSSTVEPVSNLITERLAELHPDVAVSVAGPGSGDGHKAACAGEVPVWNSSRQIKDEEVECLAEAGIDFIEMRVAIDGISVITSADNDKHVCLNFGDLYSLIGVEAEGSRQWADVNDLNAQLDGTGPFDDDDLDIFAPGEESGTFDSFIEIALEDVFDARVAAGAIGADSDIVRVDYTSSANDNVIIDGIAGNTYSLGWVGFAFADHARDQVKLLEIDGGDGCVAPTPQTIAAAQFPISRFLYTYIDVAAADNPAVAAYVDLLLSEEGQQMVTQAGYVNLTPADLAQAKTNWESRTTGKTFG